MKKRKPIKPQEIKDFPFLAFNVHPITGTGLSVMKLSKLSRYGVYEILRDDGTSVGRVIGKDRLVKYFENIV